MCVVDYNVVKIDSSLKDVSRYLILYIQSSLAITLSPGGIFWDRGISEARYRFCRQVGFFFFCIYFLTANCFIFYVLCHDVLLPLTMSILYLFVSVLLLYQSVIKIDVPNKWASACVQPAIANGR